MSKILNKYSYIFFFFIGYVLDLLGAPDPAVPAAATSAVPPPPPPGTPIDQDLLILLCFALLFGFYKIYIFTKKKKRSV